MGRKSTVGTLPEPILDDIERARLENATVSEITEQVNEALAENGIEKTVKRSAMGRYLQATNRMAKKIAEDDRLTSTLIKELNIDNQSAIGQFTAESLKLLVRNATLLLDEKLDQDEISIKDAKELVSMINQLSVSHARLESAATVNEKRTQEIEQRALIAMKEAMKAQGIDDDKITVIERVIVKPERKGEA